MKTFYERLQWLYPRKLVDGNTRPSSYTKKDGTPGGATLPAVVFVLPGWPRVTCVIMSVGNPKPFFVVRMAEAGPEIVIQENTKDSELGSYQAMLDDFLTKHNAKSLRLRATGPSDRSHGPIRHLALLHTEC